MSIDAIFSGPPSGSPFPSGYRTCSLGLDTNTGALWVNNEGVWQGVSDAIAKATVLSTTAAQATLLVFTAPVSGLYRVSLFTAQATSTNGTLPTATVLYTDADTSASVTATLVGTGTVTTGQGQSQSAQILVNAKAGTTITVDVAAPTTLTANEKSRIEYVG